MQNLDPYHLHPDKVLAPPETFLGRLKHLGPSLILSASIVGSGELIATTTLGAKAGYLTFWVILLSCVIKVMIQLEFGKITILTGKTTMEIMGELPGPKFRSTSWSVWLMAFIFILKFLQVGGIVGGVAITLNMLFPFISIPVFAFLVAALAAFLVQKGYYHTVEKISLYMIAFFTVFTFASLYFLKYTAYPLSWENVVEGLQFKLPAASLAFVFGAFGITGVSGDETLYYNYWCLEKGYAAFTGENDQSETWKKRAEGWIKVMKMDAVLAMVVYTSVTAAFYLLGAAVLFQKGSVPEGYEMINQLSSIFTESFGPSSKQYFIFGAFVILFSTVFAALASWTRLLSDIFGQFKMIDFRDLKERNKAIFYTAWVCPMVWAILFLFIQLPMFMVLTGGMVSSFLLFLVIYTVLHNKYRYTDKILKPSSGYDTLLWLSILSITSFCVYGLMDVFW